VDRRNYTDTAAVLVDSAVTAMKTLQDLENFGISKPETAVLARMNMQIVLRGLAHALGLDETGTLKHLRRDSGALAENFSQVITQFEAHAADVMTQWPETRSVKFRNILAGMNIALPDADATARQNTADTTTWLKESFGLARAERAGQRAQTASATPSLP
jgi:hypothetical protein